MKIICNCIQNVHWRKIVKLEGFFGVLNTYLELVENWDCTEQI